MVYCLSLEYQYPSECLTVRLVCDSDSLIITRRCRESIPVPHSPKHHPLQFEIHPVNMSAITWPSVYLLSTRIIYTCTYSCQCTSYSVVLNILFTHTHIHLHFYPWDYFRFPHPICSACSCPSHVSQNIHTFKKGNHIS